MSDLTVRAWTRLLRSRAAPRTSPAPGFAAYKAARWRDTSHPAAASAYVAMFARDGLSDPTRPISVPLLAITGEQDAEPMRSAAVTRVLSPLCDRLQVIAFADSGHYPMQEMPPLFVRCIERFLLET